MLVASDAQACVSESNKARCETVYEETGSKGAPCMLLGNVENVLADLQGQNVFHELVRLVNFEGATM